MDRWTDGQMDGWMDGWPGRNFVCWDINIKSCKRN